MCLSCDPNKVESASLKPHAHKVSLTAKSGMRHSWMRVVRPRPGGRRRKAVQADGVPDGKEGNKMEL